jgi:signal transduction histidine kinase
VPSQFEEATAWGAKPPRARGPFGRGLTGGEKVSLFAAGMVLLAAALYYGIVQGMEPLDGKVTIPWWALTAMFCLGEILVVHVQFRRNAYSFSLSEIPLIIGLFASTPQELVLGHVLGSAIALIIHRRQSLLKLMFNLSHFALESCLALLVFHAFGPEGPFHPMTWVAAFVTTFAVALVADFAVGAAISLSEGKMELQSIIQGLPFGKVVAATNTSIGLIGVMVLWTNVEAAWLLAVPAAILFFAYRIYTSQREQHERMEFLYESTHLLNRSLKMEASLPALLSQARSMFRAELAEILLFAPEGEPMLRTVLGPGEAREILTPVRLDPTEGVWARMASEGQSLLFTRPIQPERLRRHFQQQGIRDAMVAPLRGTDGIVGIITVGNRLGDVSTFDPNDLKLFEALANHASVSLENARLVQRLEESLVHMTEMNRMKDDFVATVSHELRTPLTSIQGSVKTLLQPGLEFDESDRLTLLEVVDRQGERLRQLIEDLLVAARIESAQIQPVISPVSLIGLAKQVVEGLGSRAATHRFLYDVSADPGAVETDERRAYQILSNLVDNALKYSAPDTTITMRLRAVPGGAEVAVQDEGHGIPVDEQDRIFDRFFQVDQTSTRAVGGTGLGLYICRRLADVIGAKIDLEQSDENGSIFTLWIPTTPPADALRASDLPKEETLDLIAAQRG